MTTTALVYGMAISGEAVARALHDRGVRVLVADDAPSDAKSAAAAAIGAELVASPVGAALDDLVASCDMVCPAPGVPEMHRVIESANRQGKPIRTEIDLAYEWEQQRGGGPRPMLAVTGTDGKTTTTMMAAAMLRCAGLKAAAVGNTELPLIAALDTDVDAFVVECSSFRLNWLAHFRSEASVWLNLAPDHQNWHISMQAYEQSKARMWSHNLPTDVAVGFAADEVVTRYLAAATGRKYTFGTDDSDYRLDGAMLTGPAGPIANRATMTRDLPHDVSNALAAAAIAIESGLASSAAVAEALATFEHPPHRIEPIGEFAGARWYNDSKATTPHAAITAIRGFTNVVLLAGGRNKGLDLAAMANEHGRVKAVVALGEAAPIIHEAFAPWCEVVDVGSMQEAVDAAARFAAVGDTVLLSPGCASFDWYPDGGYPARGDDFKRLVHEHFEKGSR
jgi:UDP-N-acetylmuramoylalanine--D-glutamate ligase